MKIKYLGTAAAEAVPAPFCECNVCEYARKQGGKNIRTRSQALIDGKLLIDFPADTFMHTLNEKFKLSDISACIITHSHSDHLYPAELFCRESCAAHMKQEHPFVMIGTEDIIESIHADYPNSYLLEKEKFLELHPIVPFVPFEVEEYKITPLAADHSTKQPVIYIIEKDDKAILYAHDTGFFPDKTMEYLAKSSVCFDLISYDCTTDLNKKGGKTMKKVLKTIITFALLLCIISTGVLAVEDQSINSEENGIVTFASDNEIMPLYLYIDDFFCRVDIVNGNIVCLASVEGFAGIVQEIRIEMTLQKKGFFGFSDLVTWTDAFQSNTADMERSYPFEDGKKYRLKVYIEVYHGGDFESDSYTSDPFPS